MIKADRHGHGDPLFAAAMKGMGVDTLEEKETDKEVGAPYISCDDFHGDPLLDAVQKHDDELTSMATNIPLHAEFYGHGDPLIGEVPAESGPHGVVRGKLDFNREKFSSSNGGDGDRCSLHGVRKKHGDPLFRAAKEYYHRRSTSW